MDRLFLDANVLFSAAYRPDAGLLRLWKLKHATLISSRYAFEEAKINLDEGDPRARLAHLARRVELVEAGDMPVPCGIALPFKDRPILLAAIGARATHLLTGDVRHFGPYFGKKIEGITILLPGEYLRNRIPQG
ncbi:MAG TPA: hypothetical protein VGM18_02945 [Candidatus Sulfotelmatobacter sp.]|jgi:predicted nucleic acid-binding protein